MDGQNPEGLLFVHKNVFMADKNRFWQSLRAGSKKNGERFACRSFYNMAKHCRKKPFDLIRKSNAFRNILQVKNAHARVQNGFFQKFQLAEPDKSTRRNNGFQIQSLAAAHNRIGSCRKIYHDRNFLC